jgi:hypothetical protein
MCKEPGAGRDARINNMKHTLVPERRLLVKINVILGRMLKVRSRDCLSFIHDIVKSNTQVHVWCSKKIRQVLFTLSTLYYLNNIIMFKMSKNIRYTYYYVYEWLILALLLFHTLSAIYYSKQLVSSVSGTFTSLPVTNSNGRCFPSSLFPNCSRFSVTTILG